MSRSILFRVDGGSVYSLGLGHVYRCLRLASLFKQMSVPCLFVMKNYSAGVALVKRKGFAVEVMSADVSLDHELFILTALAQEKDAIVFFDLRTSIKDLVLRCRADGIASVVYEDDYIEETTPEILFNPSLSEENKYRNDGGNTRYCLGLEYIVLDPNIDLFKRHAFEPVIKKIFVCFGGADPCNISSRILNILLSDSSDVRISLALGPAFECRNEVERLIHEKDIDKRVCIVQDSDALARLHGQHDAAITAGGTLVYESIALSVPALIVPTIKHEAEIAQSLAERGYVQAISNDVAEVSEEDLKQRIAEFISDLKGRRTLYDCCRCSNLAGGLVRVVSEVRAIM